MDVKVPNLGEGADSGSVVSLLVKEGEEIKKGQTILELENEKAVAPIPSPSSGKISKIRVKEGDKLTVGQVILSLSEAAEPDARGKAAAAPGPAEKPAERAEAKTREGPPAEAEPAPDEKGSTEAPEPARARSSPEGAASPSVRKLARELGIDLAKVQGSERGGRIVLADLRSYIARLQSGRGADGRKEVAPPGKPAEAEAIDFSQWGPVKEEPLSATRKTISRRMLESWTKIPHVTQFASADLTRLNELRQQYEKLYQSQGARLTLTPMLLKATVMTLQKFPRFNASLNEAKGTLVIKNYFHIGVAVDTENGLIVPVIRDVDKKPILELAKDVSSLAERARERKIGLAEIKGGTFTISNQGAIGGGHFTPIINRPEVAILGLGRAALTPVMREKEILGRLLLPLSLSYDHRVLDGAEAARFAVALVEAIENFPEESLK